MVQKQGKNPKIKKYIYPMLNTDENKRKTKLSANGKDKTVIFSMNVIDLLLTSWFCAAENP